MSKRVVVVVDDGADIQKVVDELSKKGFNTEQILKNIGIISGTTDDIAAISSTEGVVAVEENRDDFKAI